MLAYMNWDLLIQRTRGFELIKLLKLLIPSHVCMYVVLLDTNGLPFSLLTFSFLAPLCIWCPLSTPAPLWCSSYALLLFQQTTMDGNSSGTLHHCPKCCNKEFQSLRALSIHMHTCNVLFSNSINDNTQKRTHMQLTLAQRAEQIFQAMKKPHTSGNQLNVDRLSVPHANHIIPSVATNVDTTNDIHGYNYNWNGDEYCTDVDFTTECNQSIPSSTDCYQFDCVN